MIVLQLVAENSERPGLNIENHGKVCYEKCKRVLWKFSALFIGLQITVDGEVVRDPSTILRCYLFDGCYMALYSVCSYAYRRFLCFFFFFFSMT